MPVTNSFIVEIDGQRLPAEVDLAAVLVEDHLHLPDSFSLTLRDASRKGLETSRATIGSKISVAVLNDATSSPVVLIKGEVTALEAEIHRGTSFTIVRGYDQSHRLMHGRVTESYKDATYADIAKKVGQRHGLQTGKVEATSPSHPHVTQANENDWDFLRRLASEVGFEVTVADGKMDFRKPVAASAAPTNGDLSTDDATQLLVGANILELRATITSAEQVKEVEVRGWDPKTKKAVVATAPNKTATIDNELKPADLASKFAGPKLVAVDVPMATTTEVDNAAKALAEQVANVSTEMEGTVRGDPKLRAGTPVRVGLLGKPFDGRYVLTTTRHTYDQHEGYVTAFSISGRQERSMYGLASGGAPSTRVPGVVPAIVDDVNDPDKQGRVRVKFPWLAELYVSDWCRVAQPGAGKDRGFMILPEVGDEVLVAFEQGEMRRPFVLSGLHNGVDKAKTGPGDLLDGSSKAVNNRLFTSRKGHQLVFVDADDGCGVQITTGDGKVLIKLDQANKKIEVTSSGDIVLKATGDLTVKTDGSIKMEATGSFEVKAQSVKLEGQTNAGVKGAQVSVEASGPLKVAGNPIQLN